jgi:preprotein translocase subunit SecF
VRGFAVVHCLGILTSIFSSVVVSRPGQPDLRPPEETDQGRHRPDLETRRRSRFPEIRSNGNGIFPHQKDIPFMRHALVFNVISFVTFILAVSSCSPRACTCRSNSPAAR